MIKNVHIILIMVLLAMLQSCASAGAKNKTRYKEGDNSGQQAGLTPAQEMEMTKQMLPQLEKEYPASQNQELQNYIKKVGRRVVDSNNLEGSPYHYTFTVVDVDYVNAFALPGGVVYVTRPLIAMTETESELAGVIGHEVGHVMARHAAERMYKEEQSKKSNLFKTIGGGLVGAAAGYGVGTLVCKKGDTECMAKAVIGGGGVGAAGALLVQKYAFMQNSQEDEMEADRIGFKLAANAGFSKDHIGKFYEKLYKLEQQNSGANAQNGMMKSLSDAMSTHPPSQKRIDQMNEMSAVYPAQKNPVISSPDYLGVKKKL